MYKLIVNFIIFSLISCKVFAVAGPADKYEVTMKKVELCQSSSCASPTEVANGSQVVDIASLTAGQEAAKFGSTSGLPLGMTYTHIRVTINRSFTIEGEINVTGNIWCSTDGNAAGTATALHTGTKKTDNSPTAGVDTTLYVSNEGSYGNDSSITMDYSSPKALSMAIATPTTDEMQVLYALTTPYTVGPVAPKIKVSFDTSVGLGAGIDGGGNCLMWPEEPTVAISFTQ